MRILASESFWPWWHCPEIPVKFVRHYEDAAHIIQACGTLPPMEGFDRIEDLILEMTTGKQIRVIPDPRDASFNPDASPRWNGVRTAHRSIQPMFWGPRLSLEAATTIIRTFLESLEIVRHPLP